MTRRLTMPGDPGQPRRAISARENDDMTRQSYEEIRRVVDQVTVGFTQMSDSDTQVPKAMHDFLLFAFIAETDLMPSQTMLIQRRDQATGEVFYAFEKKDPRKVDLGEMLRASVETNVQHIREIARLRDELDELRQSR